MFRLFVVCLIASLASKGISFQHEGRIVGGMPARKGQFPFQISVRDVNNVHLCSGAKLNRRWIATTASCLTTNVRSDYVAVAGALFTLTGGTPHDISEVVMHPRFNFNTMENDIALLHSAFDMPDASNAIQPIEIARGPLDFGVRATVSGWGSRTIGGGLSPMLDWATVETVEINACAQLFPEESQHLFHENQVCAIGTGGFGGNCAGDGGNPLVVNNQLIGLASFGIKCGTGVPDVYTDVTSHTDWINEVLEIDPVTEPDTTEVPDTTVTEQETEVPDTTDVFVEI